MYITRFCMPNMYREEANDNCFQQRTQQASFNEMLNSADGDPNNKEKTQEST